MIRPFWEVTSDICDQEATDPQGRSLLRASDEFLKLFTILFGKQDTQDTQACAIEQEKGPVEDPNEAKVVQILASPRMTRDKTVIRLP